MGGLLVAGNGIVDCIIGGDGRYSRAAAYQYRYHFTFLPAYAQRIAQVSTAIFASLVCAILAKYTYNFVQMEFQAPSMAFAQVPTWLCESIMPISFSIMSLRYCLFALQDAIAYQGNAA